MDIVKVSTSHLEVYRCCVAAGDFPEPQLENVRTPFSEEEWKVSSHGVAVSIYELSSL
jgi:hypothetical protein